MISVQFAGAISVTGVTDIRRFAGFVAGPWQIKNTMVNGIFSVAITACIFAFVIATDMVFRTFSIVHTTSAFPGKAIRPKKVAMTSDFL